MLDRIDELDIEIAKSGHDKFSKLKLDALRKRLPREFEEIAARLSDPSDQAFALRWVLRNRSVEWAIAKAEFNRKVKQHFHDEGHRAKEIREILGY